jgi:hypothetical protein
MLLSATYKSGRREKLVFIGYEIRVFNTTVLLQLVCIYITLYVHMVNKYKKTVYQRVSKRLEQS